MLTFRVQNVVPPGGKYFYEVPETRTYFEDLDSTRLETRIARHLRENSLPVPDGLQAVIRDFMCRRLPSGFCEGEKNGPPERVLTTAEVRERTRRLVMDLGSVDAGTSRERAQKCGECRLNDRTACPLCAGLNAWATRAVGGRTTELNQILGICLVDGVLLTAKVFVQNVPENPDYPSNCWRKV